MEYDKIVEKMRKKERVMSREITGFQHFKLLRDRVIPDVKCENIIYEINFIPTPFSFNTIDLDEKEEDIGYFDALNIVATWIEKYEKKQSIYVKLEDIYYEIIIDILETP